MFPFFLLGKEKVEFVWVMGWAWFIKFCQYCYFFKFLIYVFPFIEQGESVRSCLIATS